MSTLSQIASEHSITWPHCIIALSWKILKCISLLHLPLQYQSDFNAPQLGCAIHYQKENGVIRARLQVSL